MIFTTRQKPIIKKLLRNWRDIVDRNIDERARISRIIDSLERELVELELRELAVSHTVSELGSAKRRLLERHVEVLLNLELDMGQSLIAEAVVCDAWLFGGGLQRLCLQADTIFEGNAPRTILSLPAGLDVLEGMSRESKIEAWEIINGSH